MNIDDKINNIRAAIKNNGLGSVKDNKIFDAILDVLQDISNEIEELNEMMYV
jgi:archaellum component FlaC